MVTAVVSSAVLGVFLWKFLTDPDGELAGAGRAPCFPPSHYAPPADAGYAAEDVRFTIEAGHDLVGTLTLPKIAERPLPVVVLISGSHAQDRDHVGSYEEPFSFYRPFRQIADALSHRGIAVLRIDDQGTGCSEGGPIEDIPIPERAQDTRAALTFLRSRPDIDPRRIGLVGISEGANIAIYLAARNPSIEAIVTLGATATPGWNVYVSQQWQLIENDIYTDDERKRLSAGVSKETILADRTNAFRREVSEGKRSRWWQSFMAFNPAEFAADVTCPVLIVHGDRDSNVPVSHAYLLEKAIRSGGNEAVTVNVLTDHNHLLLEDKDGFFRRYPKLLEHTNQLTEEVLTQIADWLAENLRVEG